MSPMTDQFPEEPPEDLAGPPGVAEDVPEHVPEVVESQSDAPEHSGAGDADPGTDQDRPATGHPAVDEVLRSLEDLDGRPVDEHVAVFEQAHEALRHTLSTAGDDQD